jgi:hypothetical protein
MSKKQQPQFIQTPQGVFMMPAPEPPKPAKPKQPKPAKKVNLRGWLPILVVLGIVAAVWIAPYEISVKPRGPATTAARPSALTPRDRARELAPQYQGTTIGKMMECIGDGRFLIEDIEQMGRAADPEVAESAIKTLELLKQ